MLALYYTKPEFVKEFFEKIKKFLRNFDIKLAFFYTFYSIVISKKKWVQNSKKTM